MDRWRADGVAVVLIGNGNASFAEAFREDFELEGPILVDPELAAYRAAGLRRGGTRLAAPRSALNAFRALRSGARQGAVEGDPWQLGGVFVISEGGDLLFASRSKEAGDHASGQEISEALSEKGADFEERRESSAWAPLAKMSRAVLDLSPVLSFDRIGFARHALGFDPDDLDVDLYGRRCLVTGANTGIGFQAALALADLGAEVELLCRNRDRGEEAVSLIREATGNRRVGLVKVDLSSLRDVDRAARTLSQEPIDVLVQNAGLMLDQRVETKEGLEATFATHVAGPHRLLSGLRKGLEASDAARVIWVSSGGMLLRRLELEDPQWESRTYDGVRAYAETKRAQVVLAELWAAEFEKTQVCVNSMHPGWADTAGVRSALPLFHQATQAVLRTPAEGADTILWLAASDAVEGLSGQFFFDREPVRTHWIPGTQETVEEREAFWELCENL